MAQVERAPLLDEVISDLLVLSRLFKVEPDQELAARRLQKRIEHNIARISDDNELMAFSLELSMMAINGQMDKAEALYEQYIDQRFSVLHHNMAMSYIYHYDMQKALICAQRSYEITPDDPMTRDFYGVLLLEQGQLDAAHDVFEGGRKFKDKAFNKLADTIKVIFDGVREAEIPDAEVCRYLQSVTEFAKQKNLFLLGRRTELYQDEGVFWTEFRYETGLDFDTNDELEDELTDCLIDQDINPRLMGLINIRFF